MANAESSTSIARNQQEEFWDCLCMLLPRGHYALIDSDYFSEFVERKWSLLLVGRDRSHERIVANKRGGGLAYLHREVMGCPPDLVVDHRNHNGRDNRRSNLRICTLSQNNMNSRKKRNATSRYKGVSWCSRRQVWTVMVGFKHSSGREKYLGSFKNEEEAALAYNVRAAELFGDFALLNDLPTKGVLTGESGKIAANFNG